MAKRLFSSSSEPVYKRTRIEQSEEILYLVTISCENGTYDMKYTPKNFKSAVVDYYKSVCTPHVRLYQFNDDPNDILFIVGSLGDGGPDKKKIN